MCAFPGHFLLKKVMSELDTFMEAGMPLIYIEKLVTAIHHFLFDRK